VTVSVEIGNAHGGTEAEQRNVTERGRLCDVRGSGGGVARSERCYRKWMRANGRAGGESCAAWRQRSTRRPRGRRTRQVGLAWQRQEGKEELLPCRSV
jgi:hypothetical protein